MRHNNLRQISVLAAAAALPYFASPAGAINKSWAAPVNGNWTTAAAWNPANPPANGDLALILQDSPTNYLVTYDNPSTTQVFPVLGLNSNGVGVAQMRSASGVVYNITEATIGSTGRGFWQIGSGTANVDNLSLGGSAGGAGTVTLSSGAIDSSDLVVGANGTGFFSQSGGSTNVADSLIVATSGGSVGTASLSNGTMTVGIQTLVGNFGSGIFNQSGGVHNTQLLNFTTVGTGVYNLQGGTLNPGSVSLKTGGTFNQTGGTISGGTFEHVGGIVTGSLTNNGTYRYTSGTFTGRMINDGGLVFLANATFGNGMENHTSVVLPLAQTVTFNGLGLAQRGGTLTQFSNVNSSAFQIGGGTFNQQGGLHAANGGVVVGSGGVGTFNLNNGTLNAQGAGDEVLLGQTHTGFLGIGNGTLLTNAVRVGAGAAGTLNHGGTGDLSAATIEIGVQSVGRYNHNNAAGSASASIGLVIGTQGQYDLVSGTLFAAQTSNNGSFNQTGGVANLNAIIGATGDMSVFGTASLSVDRIRQDSLFVGDTARIFTTANGTANGVSRMNSLLFEESEFNIDGRWDVNNNDVVIDYTGVNTPAVSIRAYIQSGYNFGAWNGDGLNSSAAIAAATTVDRTALGYAEASEVFGTFPATFVGQTVDNTTFLVRYTLVGDNNLDGTANISDFSLLATNFNTPGKWIDGDYNYDNMVNITDFSLLASNFNQSLAAPLPRGGAVPEPSTISAGIAALLLISPRRARRARRDALVRITKTKQN